jgi:hypothetical protein
MNPRRRRLNGKFRRRWKDNTNVDTNVNVRGGRTASGSCSKAMYNRLNMSHAVSHLFFISSAFIFLE